MAKLLGKVPWGRCNEFEAQLKNPERTAKRDSTGGLDFDVLYYEFSNRPAMLKTIEMQMRGEDFRHAYRPVRK